MRTPMTLFCAAALCLTPFAPAAAEPEPDNALWEATGPVQTDTITGTVVDTSDSDWYMLYASANTPLTLTLQPSCKYQKVTLGDETGQPLAEISGDATLPKSLTHQTAAADTQYLIRVSIRNNLCAGSPYTVNLSPSSSLLPGAPMPTATPMGESGDDVGPLTGDVWYQAELPVGDQDSYFMYADSPLTVKGVNSGCEVNVDVGGGSMMFGSRISTLAYSPGVWDKVRLTFSRSENYNVGCVYRFLIAPASAVKSGPRPLAPPTTKVQGLTYKKIGKRVIVRWKALPGAIGYEFRYALRGKYVQWGFIHRTRTSFKVKVVPKKGMKVQVRARNDDGAGPKRTIRVTL